MTALLTPAGCTRASEGDAVPAGKPAPAGGAFGVAMLVLYAVVPGGETVLPGAGFFATLGRGMLAAVAITLITWPLENAATGHDSVRIE
jgi:hypothetical protein